MGICAVIETNAQLNTEIISSTLRLYDN